MSPAVPHANAPVSLREITRENLRTTLQLEVSPDQREFVAPVGDSIAEAHYAGDVAWYRAIYAGEEAVGFVMIVDDPAHEHYYLWRLLVDHRHQGRGYGAAAMREVVDYVRSRPGARRLGTSYHGEAGGPAGFYERIGFVPTGEVDDDGEIEAVLELT
ncbi:diamine N-acetyltransferase [Georgenia soli]|uniref:Diamine N-acetyltransferase n=1 Tax=Georgenia soli TaxID=638953 RepID=A0A2A9ERX6_9MICO|nr:diamine N-acetyltransferase [Georgenia soli]